MAPFQIRSAGNDDRTLIARLLTERWLSAEIVTRGRVHHADRLPGFVAYDDDQLIGLATYRIDVYQCEVVSLDSLREKTGVGSALLDAVVGAARAARCRRVWLVTTNDNQPAIRFYERRGWKLAAVHRGAVEQSRRLKPAIPRVGLGGAPISDEHEFELIL